ncbi:hypothetical protein GF359_01450 [candidate division WOR-3 bacterium]|uniref:Uncharacterized protein n=1 Tax=candidate division WOR-3 bacterium TaxID=2052148 RepID=A0A9D5K814_UNCW3|nr:hypothetical protein [candidate division WOR-3 bacterium]MBD3363860.1 hypothetical protein [candidate division WOR-3 bacterium]
MKRCNPYILLCLFLLTTCGNQAREKAFLAQRTYELGYLTGVFFTLNTSLHFVAGTLSASEIDVDEEALKSWRDSGYPTMKKVCDSMGVAFDTSLSLSLFDIYREAYITGILEEADLVEGRSPTPMDTIDDSMVVEIDELARARIAFENDRRNLLSILDKVDLNP